MKFKVGDKVVINQAWLYNYDVGDYRFTKGEEYTVEETDSDDTIYVSNDEADYYWFEDEYFDLASGNTVGNIKVAESLLGTSVTFNKKKYVVNDWCRIIPSLVTQNTLKVVKDIVAKEGSCICLVSGSSIFPQTKAVKLDDKIVLNKEYNAFVFKDIIQVGCQPIPYTKVLEIVDRHKELYGN